MKIIGKYEQMNVTTHETSSHVYVFFYRSDHWLNRNIIDVAAVTGHYW